MRAGSGVLLVGCVALCAQLACSPSSMRGASQALPAVHDSRHRAETGYRDAFELAALLPRDADRCVVASPGVLAPSDVPAAQLLSQLDGLPWSLALPVSAYARAEFQPANDRRRVREYVRFRETDRALIRAELDRVLEPRISWGTAPDACRNELTCVVVEARFVDDRTVEIATGDWPYDAETRGAVCTPEAVSARGVLEYGIRRQDYAAGESLGSEMLVEVENGRFQRRIRRLYADDASADFALRRALMGTQDVPSLAGVALDSVLLRDGSVVEQRLRGSFDDLWLALDDRERLRRALKGQDEPAASEAIVDVRDAERVRKHVDQTLSLLARFTPEEQSERVAALDGLLSRARREHPEDDGLTRRHFALRLERMRDLCGAAEVAEERLSTGVPSEQPAWRLAQRRALAGCDQGRLQKELAREYDLSLSEASHMASELSEQVKKGLDYERAEWGYRTAQELTKRAKKHRLVPTSARIPLASLPRALAYLALLDEDHQNSDLGVHILALSEHREPAPAGEAGVWMATTRAPGRPAVVLAAATWDESQLEAEGRLLASRFPEGELELNVAIDVIGREQTGAIVRLVGNVVDGELVVERASKAASLVRWDLFERYLARPLGELVGAHFPPDELTLALRDRSELMDALSAVQMDRGMRCEVEGFVVRCRGPLDDTRAAARALVRVARTVLGAEAKALWRESE